MLAADRAAAGTVDRQTRDVDHRQAGVEQHRLEQAGDPTEQVDTHPGRTVLGLRSLDLPDQVLNRRRRVLDRLATQHPAGLGSLDLGPMNLFGHIYAHCHRHVHPPFARPRGVQPLPAVHAYTAIDRSSNQRSGRSGEAGAEPTWPSSAAVMKAIPASPARTRSCRLPARSDRTSKGRAS